MAFRRWETGKQGLVRFRGCAGLNQSDSILIYRQAVPVGDLDKPHSQTLAVCFYDPTQKKYIKNFSDDGGPILWVKVFTDTEKKARLSHLSTG